ncbi:hypothetical protein KW484_11105 [Vibrio fluvialis]|jgi:hypothetical protein|nr:hypothetical protein [Vibrio fluvialis]
MANIHADQNGASAQALFAESLSEHGLRRGFEIAMSDTGCSNNRSTIFKSATW